MFFSLYTGCLLPSLHSFISLSLECCLPPLNVQMLWSLPFSEPLNMEYSSWCLLSPGTDGVFLSGRWGQGAIYLLLALSPEQALKHALGLEGIFPQRPYPLKCRGPICNAQHPHPQASGLQSSVHGSLLTLWSGLWYQLAGSYFAGL